MNKVTVILFLFAIIIVGSVYIYVRLDNNVTDFFTKSQPNDESTNNNYDEDGLDNNSIPQEVFNSGGGSGGTGSAGSSGSQANSDNCQMQQISYSLKRFTNSQLCDVYDGTVCLQKTVFCSIEVNNLDTETTGVFEIKFEFSEQGQQDVLDSEIVSHEIVYGSAQLFESTKTLQFPDSDKNITCSFRTEQVPEKQICF